VHHENGRKPMARLRESAKMAMSVVALSGFVAVGAGVAASISLWEVSGEFASCMLGPGSRAFSPGSR
jgi:hypothetical protein